MAENAVIGENAVVGARPEELKDTKDWGVAVIASGVRVGEGRVVPARAMVDTDLPPAE